MNTSKPNISEVFAFYLRVLLISMSLGIILGAIGAHALSSALPAAKVGSFKTGVLYQLIGSLSGLLLIALRPFFVDKWLIRAVNLLLIGMLLFSGSIYVLALNHMWEVDAIRWLGPITPIGGLLLIAAFLLLSFGIKKKA